MAIDIKATCDLIQGIVKDSPFIRSAPPIDEWPENVDDSDLPAVLTRPAAGDWNDKTMPRLGRLPSGVSRQYESRRGTYAVDVYVMPASAGMVYEGVSLTLQIIADLGARLANAMSLGVIQGGQSVKDQGLLTLKMGNPVSEYKGTRITVEVLERSE